MCVREGRRKVGAFVAVMADEKEEEELNEGMREEEETQHSRALAARNRSRHCGYTRTPGPTWRRVSLGSPSPISLHAILSV